MEKHNFKQGKESSCEITDSGFSEDIKDGENNTNLCQKSELFMRSPSYDLEEDSYRDAQRQLTAQNDDGNT